MAIFKNLYTPPQVILRLKTEWSPEGIDHTIYIPKNAKWLAIDKDGSIAVFSSDEPIKDKTCWDAYQGYMDVAKIDNVLLENWESYRWEVYPDANNIRIIHVDAREKKL